MAESDGNVPCFCLGERLSHSRGSMGCRAWLPQIIEPAQTEVRVTSSTGGQKGSKVARYDLIPAEPLRLLATLYGKGAEKYEDRNWERGYDWSLSFAAAQRHMWQFWNGEDIDEEMGLPHPVAAVFHMFALVDFLTKHPEFDNRPNPKEVSA